MTRYSDTIGPSFRAARRPDRARAPRALRRRAAAFTFTLVVGALAGTSTAHAAAVTAVGCDTDPVTAGTLLKTAVAGAASGDTLTLTDYCVYGFDDTNKTDLTNALVIDKNLTIQGNHATLKRTDGTLRLIDLNNNATLTMDTLAVINGSPTLDLDGGGIMAEAGSTLTGTDLTIQGNAVSGVGTGGGIIAFGTITLTGGTISDNKTAPGSFAGGVSLGGTAAFHGVTVTRNRGGTGNGPGGIYQFAGDLTIDQNSVISNNTSGFGGGVEAGGTSLTITDSSITDNSTSIGYAGGLYAHARTTTVTDSLISGNVVKGTGGGGIYVDGGALTVSGTTISRNRLVGQFGVGAGIYITVAAEDETSVTVNDGSVISENTASGRYSAGGGIYVTPDATVDVSDTSVTANKVTGTGSFAAGIYDNGSAFSLTDSTVSGNTAPSAPGPGGVWTDTQFTTTSGSTITGNTPTNCLLSPVIPTGCTG